MRLSNKVIVIAGMFFIIVAGVAATNRSEAITGEYSNLQVLPKDINSKQLSRIMIDQFEDDLGVSCNFCHSENPDTHKPDYASDAKPEKQIARAMMRMTIDINKKFFQLKRPMIGDSTLVVTCATCHHGEPHP